jgi:hypothetical protein
MSSDITFSTSRAEVGPAGRLRRFVAISLVLPTAIVVIDRSAWLSNSVVSYDLQIRVFLVWLVLKTALVAGISGRFLGNTWFGWLLLIWCMSLIDANAYWASAMLDSHHEALVNTLFSAQLGFLILWSIQGRERAAARIAGGIAAAGGVFYLATLLQARWLAEPLMVAQMIAALVVVVVCTGLRTARFRLTSVAASQKLRNSANDEKIQFGIRDVLLWTAALAPLLVVMRGVDWLAYRKLGQADVYPAALISAAAALATLATIWLTLGAGALLWRIVFFTGVIAASGFVIQAHGTYWETLYGQWPAQRMIAVAVLNKDTWLEWFALLSGLLGAMLLFFRAAGLRLVKAR